jgi:hypothetical protein
MKKLFVLLLLTIPVVLRAQVKLYDELCDPLQAVFCDYVRNEGEVMYISNPSGQYIGTLIDDKLYGWGFYLSNDGSQSFAQYRNGKIVFGLIMTNEVAKVGNDENYVMYSLATGTVVAWYVDGGKMSLDYPLVATEKEPVSPYSFKKEVYANGDVFYGEFFEGRRHGYGVYCWANGDRWYGLYKEGYRNGYGMLLKPDRTLHYGKWVGDSKVE